MDKSQEKNAKVLIVGAGTTNAVAIQKVLMNANIPCEIVDKVVIEERKVLTSLNDVKIKEPNSDFDPNWYQKFAGKKGKKSHY